MTTVTVRLFARFRDVVGGDSVDVSLKDGTVAELRTAIAERYPAVGELLRRSRVAVNGEFADGLLTASDEVALIPPVSGG